MSYDEKFTMENEDNIEFIQRVLPKDKYRNVRRFKSGGTRDIFMADYGPFSDKKVVIKVDRTPESPRAIRHVERGCNTKNELERILRIQDGEEHFIKCIIDYYIKPDRNGNERTITVENFFPGKSLQEIVEESGPLNVGEVKSVFSQILEGVRYLIREQELFHRDLKPSNILVAKGRKIKAMITDHANARSIKEIEQDGPKVLPTAGGHVILDPFSTGVFTGNGQRYDERSEIYALGINLFYSLTGQFPFEYDPDLGLARSRLSKRDLTSNGRIVDQKKHDQELEYAISKLPKKARKFGGVIRKCLAAEKGKRYSSIDDLIEDFNDKSKPGIFERLRKNWKGVGIAAALIGALGATSYHQLNKIRGLNYALGESEKYEVIANWEGSSLELKNNLVELGVSSAYVRDNLLKQMFPTDRYLTANPGETLDVTVSASFLPFVTKSDQIGIDTGTSPLEGRVYFEGFPGETFWIHPGPVDKTLLREAMGEWGSRWNTLEIPKEIEEGTHTLAVELYAPVINKEESSVKFTQPGKVIARKRIPIVIGNPSRKLDVSNLGLGWYSPSVSICDLQDWPYMTGGGYYLDFAIPEENFRHLDRENYHNLNILPNGKSTDERTLQLVIRDNNDRILGYTFVPIRWEAPVYSSENQREGLIGRIEDMFGFKRFELRDGIKAWGYSVPDRTFSDELQEYREKYICGSGN